MNHSLTGSTLVRTLRNLVVMVGLFSLAATAARADLINLVKNGSFENTTAGTGQIGFNTTVTDWTSGGYNFVFGQDEADTSGALSWFNAPLELWGANNGGVDAMLSSADGGNFIAADGAYGVQAIEQMIEGLVIGQSYTVSFEWAAAQQYGFYGDTTEQWLVNLGLDSSTQQATNVFSNCNQCFSGWMQTSMTFTATATNELLSFLAVGTPGGEPPFSLLDGVTMYANVPEPSSCLLVAAAMLACAIVLRRKRSVLR